MADNDEFYDLIKEQASLDPDMEKLLASTEGVLEEVPQVESESQGEQQYPVAQLLVFNDNRVIFQADPDADPQVLLAALHYTIQVIEQRMEADGE